MIIPTLKSREKKQVRKNMNNDSFYTSALWRSIRAQKLKKNPYCECLDCVGKNIPADMVDHIKPIEEGGSPTDMSNLQSMRNHPCHDRKRANEKNQKYKK